jgi:predicted DCC family thiol-disulfide oxidoreductase YuxK
MKSNANLKNENANQSAIENKGAVYFDGLCMACAAEINHYRRLPGSEKFLFVDITASSFKAEDHGIDPRLAHKVMHVRGVDGKLHQGVDAFRAIWAELPRYQFLHRLSERKTVRGLMDLGYQAFVILRPYLPRKKADCSASPYCEVKHD